MRIHKGDELAPPLPIGTVTLLLSDIEGSTHLWESDEDAAATAIARHYELLEAAISRHGGVRPLEQGEGDSVVGAFASASDAVAAALDAQKSFARERWPTERAVRVRIALHSGEARLRDEDNYSGPVIIRCARLRSVGHGGQILLSDATRNLALDDLPAEVLLRNLGTHRLKDLNRQERVWQVCHPDIDVDFPPLRSLDALPNNLPAQLTAFVGRESEIVELRDALKAHRLVTLTGAGGCGKTRLALQLAADVADRHSGGTWWVELAGVSDPELVTAVVASTVGVRAEPDRPLIDTLTEYLGGRNALIVLDNCEQVLSSSADFVAALLRSVADLALLATSREPLGITGELAWRVPPLDPSSSAQLFIDRAALVRPDFKAGEADKESIVQICERLDGLPLAIELAAARIRMMRPTSIATGLEDRFRLLTGGRRTSQPRQQTLEASVSWSHDLLDEAERALLRRLSVFNGGFTLEAAESVCAGGSIDSYLVLDLLGRLVDKSLVQADDLAVEVRYRLLETIRHFARDRLLESGEADQARDRHLEWMLAYAERVEPELGTAAGPSLMYRLDLEHLNLQTALEWADITGEHETVLRLATALFLFWEARGHRHQGIGGRWFARALSTDQGPSVARARALWAAAHMGIYGGDTLVTITRAPEALEAALAVGDQRTVARAGITINYARSLFDPRAGLAALTDSIELARSNGDDWGFADGLKMMTIGCGTAGDYEGALEAAGQLSRVAQGLGNKFFLAWSHAAAGFVALGRGDFSTARDQLSRAIALCDEVGDPITKWLSLCWLGDVDAQTGDYTSARALFEQVLHKGVAAEGDLARHWAIPSLGSLMLSLGDIDGATNILEPARADFESEVPWIRTLFLVAYGQLLFASGDEAGASTEFGKASEAASQIGNGPLLAQIDHHRGRLARHVGEPAKAEDFHQRALALCHEHRIVPGIAESLEALAGMAGEQESCAEAARLLGAATTIRTSIGLGRRPTDQPVYDRDLARLRQQLDEADFSHAWTEGESLTVDEVVSYASRARGERKRPSSGWASLTPTEFEVVKLAATGLNNPEIGARLFIGRATVKTHLAHVFTKLGVTSRAELAAEATRRGV